MAWYEIAQELVETWDISYQTVRGWHEQQRYAVLTRIRKYGRPGCGRTKLVSRIVGGLVVTSPR